MPLHMDVDQAHVHIIMSFRQSSSTAILFTGHVVPGTQSMCKGFSWADRTQGVDRELL